MSTAFKVLVYWVAGVGTDETIRVRNVKIRTGFDQPDDRVAAVGWCEITLDNELKRFSPGNPDGPLYGNLLPRKLVRVIATVGVVDHDLFYGWIDTLQPCAGDWSTGEVILRCIDGIKLLQEQRMSVVYASTKADRLAVQAVVDATYTPPSVNYGDPAGETTLTHYGRTWLPETTSALDALFEICSASWSRFYISRGGRVTFLQRPMFLSDLPSVALTLIDEPVDALDVLLDVDAIINDVQVVVYPVETVATSDVLWKAQNSLQVAPGETREISASYHDAKGERCGAVNVITPAATTDYTINEKADGSGFDYTGTSSVTMTVTKEATRAIISLTNNALGNLYWTKLQIRGKPIITYDPITQRAASASSQATYQKRARVFDLPMQADPNFGMMLASYLVYQYALPRLRADRLMVRGLDVLNGVNLFTLDLMDLISIRDSQSGLVARHTIRAVEYEMWPGGYLVDFKLERADSRIYWVLDDDEFSRLGSTTRLAF